MSTLYGICWWIAGAAFGWNMCAIFYMRRMRRERDSFFAEQRARLDAMQGRHESRAAEMRRHLGLPPEQRQ